MMRDLQELSDRMEIRELTERYTVGITCRDWEAVGSCYHDHATWRAPQIGHEFLGREAIVAGLRAVVEPNEFHLQMQHALTIDTLDADRATARSILHEVVQHAGGSGGVDVLGVYNDIITKIDGVWKFESRRFHVHHLNAGPLPGVTMVDYADLR